MPRISQALKVECTVLKQATLPYAFPSVSHWRSCAARFSFQALLEVKLGAFAFFQFIPFINSSYHTWPRPPFTVGMK